jgi:hypothetical protein
MCLSYSREELDHICPTGESVSPSPNKRYGVDAVHKLTREVE